MGALPPIDIDCDEARSCIADGAALLDVREASEWAQGVCPNAECIALSSGIAPLIDWARQQVQPVLVICAGGARSLRAAQALRDAGIAARSVRGGMAQWQRLGGPVTRPVTTASGDDRYLRHHLLPEVGQAGQQRLRQSRVAIVGAGGLGSPVALYLAAAGVGALRLIDDDVVERSNLQRQILHRDDRIGARKVESAAATLNALNPTVRIEPIAMRLSPDRARECFEDCDVVVDGSDNFPTRHLVNATCIALNLPWVYGAVQRFDGQVAVFDPRRGRGTTPCYRCLFPELPAPGEVPNCAEAGVLGVLPGIVGTVQASEAIKLLLGIGEPLLGRLWMIDALAMRTRELRFGVDPECPGCGPGASDAPLPDPQAPNCALRD